MSTTPGARVYRGEMTRRDFLWLLTAASASAAIPVLSGCATHPVTGERVLVGISEQQEVALDRSHSPHQFSRDFGVAQDAALNTYINGVGLSLATRSHRPQVPYSFRTVNANYINAYAFPGGSIAATRGILLEMDNEAELAALMGHEIAHVNARHSAQQAGQSLVAGLVLAGAAIAVSTSERGSTYAPLIELAGTIGASALLASYSRDHEREADSLGMDYMTRAGYPPQGMSGLMGLLVRQSKEKPGLLETMFSSHPMSAERLAAVNADAKSRYAALGSAPVRRERYMDHTARLRKIRPAIEEQQKGERLLAQKKVGEAETHLAHSLREARDDYVGLCLMAKCQIAQKRYDRARDYAAQARRVYPGEAQATQLTGVAQLALKDYPAAFQAFDAYEKALPGDPSPIFFKGIAQEAMQNRAAAAREYQRYLALVKSGSQATHATSRLKAWGVVK